MTLKQEIEEIKQLVETLAYFEHSGVVRTVEKIKERLDALVVQCEVSNAQV